MRYTFIFFFLLVLIPLGEAEVQTLPSQKQNECMVIPQSHPNATSINLTKVKFPNSTEDYTVLAMNTSNNFNYFYEFCRTQALGDYVVTTCGNGDGPITCVDFDFTVTYSGKELDQSQAFVYTGLLAGLVFFFVFVLYIIPRLPKDDNVNDLGEIVSINKTKHFRPFLMFLAYLLLTLIFFIASNISFAYLPDTLLAQTFFTLFRVMMVLVFPIAFLWFIHLFASMFSDAKLNRILDMGGTVNGKKTF